MHKRTERRPLKGLLGLWQLAINCDFRARLPG
jgi:hypothetical protein